MSISENIRVVYFLGIGGIGMSAIGRYFKSQGMKVCGYDKTRTPFTAKLESEGFDISYVDNPDHIPPSVFNHENALVIYTPAIPPDNKIYRSLIAAKVNIYKRSEVLGMISHEAFTIAVGGTHGKTTTSTMVAYMLQQCGVGFTAFLGGISTDFNSNYIQQTGSVPELTGGRNIMVVEADEYDRSFLQLSPDIAVVTSVDPDHLDIYGMHEEVKRSFLEFLYRVKENGKAVVNERVDLNYTGSIITYGRGQHAEARYADVHVSEGRFCFRYESPGVSFETENALPGFHNVENATAAIAVCLQLGLPADRLAEACRSFKGVKRRFETVYRDERYIVIDDYAHHPEELKACIRSVRELYPNRRMTGIFQPHLYSRTRDFAGEFAEALDMLDECWLLDVYPARELPIEGINSEFLALKMKKSARLLAKEDVIRHLRENKPELLVTLGAGDIDRLIDPIRELYEMKQ